MVKEHVLSRDRMTGEDEARCVKGQDDEHSVSKGDKS